MILLIAGSRTITNYNQFKQIVTDWIKRNNHLNISKIISGGARGVDLMAKNYAIEHNIEFEEYPADWKKYKLKAGYIRNEVMMKNSDLLVAFWDGKSRGTKSMISIMKNANKPVWVFKFDMSASS